jgi:hypothetical protein
MEEILNKIKEKRKKLGEYSVSAVEKFFIEGELEKLYQQLGKYYYEELNNINH